MGAREGSPVGAREGSPEGAREGTPEGSPVGACEGTPVVRVVRPLLSGTLTLGSKMPIAEAAGARARARISFMALACERTRRVDEDMISS